jgi:hypothetical protein
VTRRLMQALTPIVRKPEPGELRIADDMRLVHRLLSTTLLLSLAGPGCAEPEPEPEDPDGGEWTDGELDEPGEPDECPMTHELTGSVAGVSIDSPEYDIDVRWFNYSPDEAVATELERALIEEVGLDPDDIEDVRRYRYLTTSFDLRLLYAESSGGFTDFKVKKDLGLYFFDLDMHDVQPGELVDIYDLSAIETLRGADETEELGELLRTIVDDMRSNGRPDAVVAFEPDRLDEGARSILINLFGRDTRFATTGKASFDHVFDGAQPLTTVEHPLRSATHLSVHAEVSVGSDALELDVQCAALVVQNEN